mgnify:CR=1 FL=1
MRLLSVSSCESHSRGGDVCLHVRFSPALKWGPKWNHAHVFLHGYDYRRIIVCPAEPGNKSRVSRLRMPNDTAETILLELIAQGYVNEKGRPTTLVGKERG